MRHTASEIIVNILRESFPEAPRQQLQRMALDIQARGRSSQPRTQEGAGRPETLEQ